MAKGSDPPVTILPIMNHKFETWLERHLKDRRKLEQILLVIDDQKPVGVIKLGEPQNQKVNIHFTGVARTHRRQGVSTLLKYHALQYAKAKGVKKLSTQNHYQNKAIISANYGFNFKEQDRLLTYLYQF